MQILEVNKQYDFNNNSQYNRYNKFHIKCCASNILVNKGTYPGIAKIDEATLQIGDERHPTLFKSEISLAPNDKQKISPIGHINKIGIKKIIGHEYISNKVVIYIQVSSKFPGDKNFQYKTSAKYLVDVAGEKPVFSLISEKIS